MRRVQEIMERAVGAALDFRLFDQQQTDAIVRAAFLAALDQRVALARLAFDETGVGRWEHKVIKNVLASLLVYEDIKDQRTVGVVNEDRDRGIIEVAWPVGPILGFVPVTNPTATTIFKVLIALKTRNPLILCPHQGAHRSAVQAAEVCYHAALEAGAPPHCVQWLAKPGPAATAELMSHPHLALILATGTDALVRKAQMSGTPTIGVGPGNVPVCIGSTADLRFAVSSILHSKTFDNGTVCASEQAVIVTRDNAESAQAELRRQGAYFLSGDEIDAVGRVAYDAARGAMRPGIVGQSVERIAQMARITVPSGSTVLVAPLTGVGTAHPLSAEILAPIVAFYVEEDFDAAIQRCTEIARFGGTGHTAVIYSESEEHIDYFARAMDASRILINAPSTHGALGGMFNALSPSFTLSCGAGANNINSDNISVRHLINIHRIARRRPNEKWVGFPEQRFLDETLTAGELESEFNRR